VSIFTDAIEWIRTDPKSFDRAIALELIMFTLTTVTLGTVFNFVQRRYERRIRVAEEKRKELILGPFRRMLVSRIASTHTRLLGVLTQYDNWHQVRWGRPRIRSLAGGVASISADLSASLLSHLDLLQEDEQSSAGLYAQRIFSLQNLFEEIEVGLQSLSGLAVGKLQGLVLEIDSALVGIADSFEQEYRDRLLELRWSGNDRSSLEAQLIKPLEDRVRRLSAPPQPQTQAPPRPPRPDDPQAQSPAEIDAG
jgi:hypothetical protein